MSSIFSRSNEQTQTPNRNVFDLSFRNNLTLKAGQITPCFLREVMPGDSVKIDASFGFNFQPMIFPVQSDMNCSLHFFYVRNRALWRGWEAFITKTEDPNNDTVPPYIQLTEENRHMFDTGQIGDYLGVPTVYYGSSNETVSIPFRNYKQVATRGMFIAAYSDEGPVMRIANSLYTSTFPDGQEGVASNIKELFLAYDYDSIPQANTGTSPGFATGSHGVPVYGYPLPYSVSRILFSPPSVANVLKSRGSAMYSSSGYNNFLVIFVRSRKTGDIVSWYMQDIQTTTMYGNYELEGSNYYLTVPAPMDGDDKYDVFGFSTYAFPYGNITVSPATITLTSSVDSSNGIPNAFRRLGELPFATEVILDDDPANTADRIRISAMPFRAVEACYNSFYRDERNNPLRIGGKEYYNIWVQNRNGGADTGVYELYNRNWQEDQFTTAVQSPQQGVLPLVGVTATGNMEFQDEEGKSYYLQADFAEDGHTITGISSYSSDMPVGTLHAMVDTISTGISINDFRNVNAFQRWLETNMRKGLRYKDQIEAHFGTSPTYSELQMPEFIGGMSRKVNISPITQTTGTLGQPDGAPLGTMAGQANVFGDAGAPVTHYCDEHGWIIGFVCVTPEPVYSQALHKQLLKRDTLDYYFPEFAHIGFQPILNQEIALLQTTVGGGNNNAPTDVFGYQRAWYEYIASFDEVHGDYRTTMRNYLIQRIFNGVPQLGVDFLTVGDDEVNEVFAVQDSDVSKIFGQIAFKCMMKRPIPKYGIPRLEVG